MIKKLLLNYLYICALSIFSQSSICLAQSADSATSSPGGQVYSNEEPKQNEVRMSDETNRNFQRRQLMDRQIRENIRQVPMRRKREFKEAISPARLQGSPNPSGKAALISGERRFKKSDHSAGKNLKKLTNNKNSIAKIVTTDDQTSQNKRDLHKGQSITSKSSVEENEAKSEQKETKRNSYSNKAGRTTKLKSRGIQPSDIAAQDSLKKEQLALRGNGGYANLNEGNKERKSVSENDELGDEAELQDKSVEYEEAADDEDLESSAKNVAYKENNPEVSQSEEESEKLNQQPQNAAENDESESQDIGKRETEETEEEYDDAEEQDGSSAEVESNEQQAKIRPEIGLSENKEKVDGRVKRYAGEAEKIEDRNLSDYAKQQLEEAADHFDDLREETKIGETRKSSLTKEQAEQSESEEKRDNEDQNESSKRDAQFQQEVHGEAGDSLNADVKSDQRLEGEAKSGGESNSEDLKKDAKTATGPEADAEGDVRNSKLQSNLDAAVNNLNLDSETEKKVEQQIKEKIEALKEEIKREVEEKQRIREIEFNNAMFDQLQNEIEEDDDENNQSPNVPNEKKNVLKRSIAADGIRNPRNKVKRHILKRVKRSDTTDPRQLRAIEGVEKLDPDVMIKSNLLHESIRKRSAPIYGAVDNDVSPLTKHYDYPRRIYLVNSEQKDSSNLNKREVRSPIIIPEQAHANIEDEFPPGLSLDASLLEDPYYPAKNRVKGSPEQFSRRRRASAVIPEGRVAFLGYRPQDDDDNEEGSEFDDDGFEDRTSNLQEDKSYADPHASHGQYHGDESKEENPANFLFAGVDRDRDDFLVRRKRAGTHEDEQLIRLHGGGALSRRQTREKAKQMQAARITSRKNVMDREKRQTGNVIGNTKSDYTASLVSSSEELSPKLATEYKEAFGGLQNDPGGALARFKRVKRGVLSHGS